MEESAGRPANARPSGRTPRWSAAARAWNLAVFAAWAIVPFAAAGTIRWIPGLAHLAAVCLGALVHGTYVGRRRPELGARRRAVGEGTKPWDIAWNLLFWPIMAAIAVAAGLDHRAHGTTLPAALWPAGAAGFAAGMALSARAMLANPFFEPTVRIQRDAGHRVVDQGPYRFVRHPGYVGLVAWALASPLLLLSARAFAAALVAAGWIALRTALEDATLRRELPGYAEYAARVRFRLVPRVW